jgi:hypothetical protein
LSRRTKRELKKKTIKTVVCSVSLYGCETWTLRKVNVRLMEVLEMWFGRRMEKVSWTAKKKNEEVLRDVREKIIWTKTIMKRKKNWTGNIIPIEGLVKDVLKGGGGVWRGYGWKRIGIFDDIEERSFVDTKRRAQNREEWRVWAPRTYCLPEHW